VRWVRARVSMRRGREQHGLAVRGGGAEDQLEVLREAHVEHLVGLVEHEGLEVVEHQGAAVDVVDRAAGGGHDDVDAALQLAQLRPDRGAAVDGEDAGAELRAVAGEVVGHLHGELAGGGQHQGRGGLVAAGLGEALHQRQAERGGLAGAGGGLAEHVVTGDQVRDGLRLHRGGAGVAHAGEHVDELDPQAQVGEGHDGLGGGGARGVVVVGDGGVEGGGAQGGVPVLRWSLCNPPASLSTPCSFHRSEAVPRRTDTPRTRCVGQAADVIHGRSPHPEGCWCERRGARRAELVRGSGLKAPRRA
jgi:hypothetical protein